MSYSIALVSTTFVFVFFISISSVASAIVPSLFFKQITANESDQYNPAIYGDKIVWQDDRNDNGDGNCDIYMYDLSTGKETRITTHESVAAFPAIYGNNIVWQDDRNGNWRHEKSDIYMYDLFTCQETQITADESYSVSPAIYGDRIVWTDYDSIHMYNLSTHKETQIIIGESMIYNPAIYGDSIVWGDLHILTDGNVSRNINMSDLSTDNETLVRDIYLYDLSTHKKTQITANGSAAFPAIYEDRIVYEDWRNGNSDIYMYNLSTSQETQITTNESDQNSPVISGDRIVWKDYRNGNCGIYMHDLSNSNETQITSESDQNIPVIYGNKIVWADRENGNLDIYMCTDVGGAPLEPPFADFSASPTSGNVPLNVMFTDNSTGSPTEWSWSFGDGAHSTIQNPKHTYSEAGNYTVALTASNIDGTDTKIKTDYIIVKEVSFISTLSSRILSVYAFACKFITSVGHSIGIFCLHIFRSILLLVILQ